MARPTHRLTLKNKNPDAKGHVVVGAAWMEPDGRGKTRGRVVLNPGVVLSHRDCEDYYINLYAIEDASMNADIPGASDGEIRF